MDWRYGDGLWGISGQLHRFWSGSWRSFELDCRCPNHFPMVLNICMCWVEGMAIECFWSGSLQLWNQFLDYPWCWTLAFIHTEDRQHLLMSWRHGYGLWGRDQLHCSWCGSLSLFQASLQLWILPNFWSILGAGHPHPFIWKISMCWIEGMDIQCFWCGFCCCFELVCRSGFSPIFGRPMVQDACIYIYWKWALWEIDNFHCFWSGSCHRFELVCSCAFSPWCWTLPFTHMEDNKHMLNWRHGYGCGRK